MQKPRLLLSACCGPCATVALEELCKSYDVTVYFWGSNIHPHDEYESRLRAIKTLSPDAIIAQYVPSQPASCEACFQARLRATAEYARANGFPIIATSLTTSPHKPAATINQIGSTIASIYGVTYLPTDFKKNNGFHRSVILSKQLGLYRQKYCGCERSQSQTNLR